MEDQVRFCARPTPGARRLVIGGIVGFLLICAPSASAESFGSTIRQVGPEQTVFDWSTQHCEDVNIPDAPVRAFTDASNQVHLTIPHLANYQMIGPDLNNLAMSCTLAMGSNHNPDPAAYDDRQWVASPYTLDGTNVYALTIDEYQGYRHPGMCASTLFDPGCWYDSVTFSISRNGGDIGSSPPFHTRTPRTARRPATSFRATSFGGPTGTSTPSSTHRRTRPSSPVSA
jgi:hypothetical protein